MTQIVMMMMLYLTVKCLISQCSQQLALPGLPWYHPTSAHAHWRHGDLLILCQWWHLVLVEETDNRIIIIPSPCLLSNCRPDRANYPQNMQTSPDNFQALEYLIQKFFFHFVNVFIHSQKCFIQ